MTTIADVAKEAGVSVATVSRVLNNQDGVRPATQKKVYDAIQKLQYEPNVLARNFRRNESRTILILSPNITNPYYAHILSGIGDMANALGYSALIFNTVDDKAREKEGLEMLRKRRADGAVLLAYELGSSWMKEYTQLYPIVQCSEFDPELDLPHVSIDNYRAAHEAVEYLIGLGHTRIGTVSSSNEYLSTKRRMQGYRDALKQNGIPVRDEYITYAARDYSFRSGRHTAKHLLEQEDRPTALFCISDTLALGAITAAKELGISVPEELAVIGFDDVEHTTMFHPYITTVSQPCYDLGRTAMKLLDGYIGEKPELPRELVVEHKLVVRESTAPPR